MLICPVTGTVRSVTPRPSPGVKWHAACWCTGALAPTEWNFHPQGAAAQVLRGLDAQQPAPQLAPAVAVLVAAFDPCVDYVLAPAGRAEEVSCA